MGKEIKSDYLITYWLDKYNDYDVQEEVIFRFNKRVSKKYLNAFIDGLKLGLPKDTFIYKQKINYYE